MLDLINAVIAAIDKYSLEIHKAARDLVMALVNGVIAVFTGEDFPGLLKAVGAFAWQIIQKIKDVLGIHSPSTVMKEITLNYWEKYRRKIPIPKLNFIEECIEIRWKVNESKLILSITDYIKDIAVYSKTKTGQYINGTIKKDDIVNWVSLWLKKIANY